jgi:uncharacterized protein (DUF849 family)
MVTLFEISEWNIGEVHAVVAGNAAVLDRARLWRLRLLQGSAAMIWDFVALAAGRGWSTRIGLEDGSMLPDVMAASGNAALVAVAAAMFR